MPTALQFCIAMKLAMEMWVGGASDKERKQTEKATSSGIADYNKCDRRTDVLNNILQLKHPPAYSVHQIPIKHKFGSVIKARRPQCSAVINAKRATCHRQLIHPRVDDRQTGP